jgi:predicted RNA-binding protein with PUA-like domain
MPLFVFTQGRRFTNVACAAIPMTRTVKPHGYWLMKSEPDVFSLDGLAKSPHQATAWWGVRNYQARNFMRDGMHLGDEAFFYHSGCAEPGIAGIVTISKLAYPDATQFDPQSEYYDAASTRENPRWLNVDVKLVRKTRFLSIKEMRRYPELGAMRVLQKANRLSITPVQPGEWKFILRLLERSPQTN